MKNFIAISGLPRTGSTLLTSILYQNPNIHTEGSSALCQLMWDIKMSCENSSLSWIVGANRQDVPQRVLSAMPEIFYGNTNAENVFDKNTSWTLPENLQLIKDYIRPDPKVIVMLRPFDQVIKSIVELRKRNGWVGDLESDLGSSDNDFVMRALCGVDYAKNNNNGEFLFIEYDDLVDSTLDVLKSVYDFCEIEYFNHDLNNIENKTPENDTYLGLEGLHEIRPTISRREY